MTELNLWDRFVVCRAQGLPGIPRDELLGYLTMAARELDRMNIKHHVQHLDVKPRNLLLTNTRIGVANSDRAEDLKGMAGSLTGGVTPVYAAPETFDGVVSSFCDQYSLAVVYQELLTGHRPFRGTSLQQLVLQHLTAAPDLSPLPASDRAVVGRALSKQPNERFPNCMGFVQALQSAGEAG
jgi:serine/threonine protein kinase